MTKVFLTSDHHFFHNNIIKYCNRPYDWFKPMNEDLIKRWNSVVGPDDIVIHLGDLTANLKGRYKELGEIVNSLNGRKSLIMGNHDKRGSSFYRKLGFEFVGTSLLKEINGKKYLFHHYPPIVDEIHPKKENQDAKDLFEKNECDFAFHGHRHLKNPERPGWEKFFNVGVDINDYTPVLLTDAIADLNLRNNVESQKEQK